MASRSLELARRCSGSGTRQNSTEIRQEQWNPDREAAGRTQFYCVFLWALGLSRYGQVRWVCRGGRLGCATLPAEAADFPSLTPISVRRFSPAARFEFQIPPWTPCAAA